MEISQEGAHIRVFPGRNLAEIPQINGASDFCNARIAVEVVAYFFKKIRCQDGIIIGKSDVFSFCFFYSPVAGKGQALAVFHRVPDVVVRVVFDKGLTKGCRMVGAVVVNPYDLKRIFIIALPED